MLNKQFIGTVKTTIISNGIVPERPRFESATPNSAALYVQIGGPNRGIGLSSLQSPGILGPDPFDKLIEWEPNSMFPSAYKEGTINGINTGIKNGTIPVRGLTYTVKFTVTSGMQFGDGFHQLYIYMYNSRIGPPSCASTGSSNPTCVEEFLADYRAISSNPHIKTIIPGLTNYTFCDGNVCPSSSFIDITSFKDGVMLLTLVQEIERSNDKYAITDFTLDMEIKVTLEVECGGADLEMGFCKAFCRENISQCFEPYKNYCLTPTSNGVYSTIRIGSNTSCQDYFKQYVKNISPDPDLDRALNAYCISKKYDLGSLNALGKLNENGDAISLNPDYYLCGCHMPQQQYNKYAESLQEAFPNVNLGSIKPQCFYTPCVVGIGSTQTGKVCPVPQCLNIVGITNNGTFDRSTINVSDKSTCKSVLGEKSSGTAINPLGPKPSGNDPPDPSDTQDPSDPKDQSFWDKYKIWIIVGGVALLLLIIIMIVIVII